MYVNVETWTNKFAWIPIRCRKCNKIIWLKHYLRRTGVLYHERINCGKCLGWDKE